METTSKRPHSLIKEGAFSVTMDNSNPPRQHPFIDYSQQIKLLENRGLIFEDRNFAFEALKSISYYTLINGYKDLFTDYSNDQENFIEGASFEMLYQLHWLDISMSNLLFKYTLMVEKKLKSTVSFLISKNFTIEENRYLDFKNYSPQNSNKGRLKELIRNIDSARVNDPSAAHYMNTEKNLPPWIAAKGISFGNIKNWYIMLRPAHKLEIINQFIKPTPGLKTEERKEFFRTCIEQVYDYRNLSAHGNRLFSLKVPDSHKILHLNKLGLYQYYQIEGTVNKTDNLFSVIMSIMILLDDKYVLYNFISELNGFIEVYDRKEFVFLDTDIYKLFDLPKDFINKLEIYYTNKITK